MNATEQLDRIDADLAAARATLEAPGFRVLSEKERRNANRRTLAGFIDGPPVSPAIEPPPSPESEAALAELLADLRRLEAEANALR